MPSFHDVPQGDMYIEYSVVMPTAVTSETRESEFWSNRPFLPPLFDHILFAVLTLTYHPLASFEWTIKK
jgi:hypothetical protein